MKKSKLTVGLVAGLLSVGVLSGCKNKEVKSSKDGVLLTYVDENGVEQSIKAGDLLEEYFNDSSKYQSIYDTVYSIVVRNYFNIVEKDNAGNVIGGSGQMAQINIDADEKVSEDEDTAKERADANGTKWKDELEKIFSEKGVKDKNELKNKYVEELQKDTFEKNFYKYHMEDIKQGDLATNYVTYKQSNRNKDGEKPKFWTGYFEDQLPYHISHILVKLEDGGSTNYANGTISKANATKLYQTVNALALAKDSFNTIARQYSEDTSDMVSGDLGIMDYATNFVPEFKLGVYAYENIVKQPKGIAKSNISMGEMDSETSIVKNFMNQVNDKNAFNSDFPEIPFSVFEDLNDNAAIEKDMNNKAVIEDATLVLPRNIIYNKYLNRHSYAFVTTNGYRKVEVAKADYDKDPTKYYVCADALTEEFEPATEEYNSKNVYYEKMPVDKEGADVCFHQYTDAENERLAVQKPILSVKSNGQWEPILTVRAGSDYQGIHFIVVNRSPFEKNRNGISMDKYYTTFYPGQVDYPNVTQRTYVNFSNTDISKTKPRAEEFESKLKSYSSDKLNKFMFRKYFELEGLSFKNAELATALDKWIDRGLDKKDLDEQEAWKKTWNSYIDTLSRQNAERKKLVPQACKIGYKVANSEAVLDYGSEGVALLPDGRNVLEVMYNEAILAKEILPSMTKDQFKALVTKIGDKADAVKTITDLYKKEGGYCNDGKTHQ